MGPYCESIHPSQNGCAATGREQHVCGHTPTGKVMLSRCMTGKRRAPAEEKVLGFYDISGARFHSPARRTTVIKVPREDEECTSGGAVLDKAMYGTKDAAQSFDAASENAIPAMGYDTSKFSPCLYHSSADDMSVFRHGDDFVMSGTRTQQKELENSCPSISSSSILPHWDHAQHWETSQKSRCRTRL